MDILSGFGNNASSLLVAVRFPGVSLSASGKVGPGFGPTSRAMIQLLDVNATADR